MVKIEQKFVLNSEPNGIVQSVVDFNTDVEIKIYSPLEKLNGQNLVVLNLNTGGPRYMREKGTLKIGSHIMNSHIKISKITISEKSQFFIHIYAKSQIKRPHLTRAACIVMDL